MKKQIIKYSRKLAIKAIALVIVCTFLFSTILKLTKVEASGTITGTVYIDFNMNGAMNTDGIAPNYAIDRGVENVTVTAYDSNGVNRGSVTTNSTGFFTLNATGTGPYRIEFTNLPSGYFPSAVGTNNASTVRFVPDGTTANVDLGIIQNKDYTEVDPLMVVPVYTNGNPLGGGTAGTNMALAGFRYSGTDTRIETLATGSQIGATWGVAYQSNRSRVFSAATIKRHVGLGPQGKGGIYVTNIGATYTTSNFIDLTAAPYNLALGALGTNTVRGLPADKITPNNDVDAFAAVGKQGLGDIDIDETGNNLWGVNINTGNQSIFKLDVSAATPGSFVNYPLSGFTGVPTCTNGVFRPWALAFNNGLGYLGGVCSAETAGARNDLRGYVLSFNPSSPTAFTTVLDIPLNYDKGIVYNDASNPFPANTTQWYPWTDTYTDAAFNASSNGRLARPTPIMSDIEFDTNNSMSIGFLDRATNQIGYVNYRPIVADTTFRAGFQGGDILKACQTAGVWSIENNSSCGSETGSGVANTQGPGNGEFYALDMINLGGGSSHNETSSGSLANYRGSREVISTSFDPVNQVSAQGVIMHNTTNGAKVRGVQLYADGLETSNGLFGKANGIGDIELLKGDAPLQVGNLIWNDTNGNGIQDSNEAGIPNVDVQLWADTDSNGTVDTQVGTVQTDGNGNYVFGGINNTNLSTTGATCTGKTVSSVSVGSDDGLEQSTLAVGNNFSNNILFTTFINAYRFTNVNVPKNATITSANIFLTSRVTSSTTTLNQRINAQDSDNPPTIANVNSNISGRTLIPTSVDWNNIPAFTAGTRYSTPNIGTIVQSLVNRPGWVSGNSMFFTFRNNASVGSPSRDMRAFESGVSTAPSLEVNYTFPCTYTLNPNTAYQVRVPSSEFGAGQPLNALYPTNDNNDATANGDSRDSDGTGITGGHVAADFVAGNAGENSHTFDFGFSPTSTYSIGNRVWYDTNNNGRIDAVEVGIGGISVSVFTDTGCNGSPDGTALQTLTTDSNGYYRFDGLAAGCYIVRINPSNFSGTLSGYKNTTGNVTGDTDSDTTNAGENGVDPSGAANSVLTNGIISNTITLGPGGSEPTGETDVAGSGVYAGQGSVDNQADMTVDFGFYELCVGGTFWNDNGAGGGGNNNGIQDGTEAGIPAVRVYLYDAAGNPIPVGPDGILGTADDGTNSVLTNSSGVYHFRGLLPGDYRVASSNGTSSTPTTLDPNPNVDLDDNGFPSGSAIGAIPAGYIVTNPITLTPRGEPAFNDLDGTTANTTLDLGFIASPTAVKMSYIKAERVNGGVGLTWESGYESENLGYQVWREVNGEKQLVNRDLIAGNALKTGTALTAGDTYRFLDKGSKDSNVSYYIEAIDSKGDSEIFGPIVVEGGNERHSFQADSPLMADLSQNSSVENQTEQVLVKQSKSLKSTLNKRAVPTVKLSSFAGKTAIKLEVTQDGWYAVKGSEIRAIGLNQANWQMWTDGREEAIYIDENSRGNIEFYGRGIESNETRARVYWLIEGDSFGKRINRLKSGFDENANSTWNNYVAERRDKSFRASGILNGEMENWYSMSVTPSGANQTFNLSEIATESGQIAKVSVDLQGATAGEHRVVMTLNGIEIGTTNFSNTTRKTFTVEVPVFNLQEGLNTVNLKSAGAGFDVSFVEAMRITYPRRLVAVNDRLSLSVEAGQNVKLEGFSSSTIRLFEVNDSANVAEFGLEGKQQPDGKYSFSVPIQAQSKQYLAMADVKPFRPKVVVNEVSDLRNSSNEAKFIIIAPKEFHNSLNVLKASREAEGLKTLIVDVVDIYDEFNGGMRSAKAIKDFLQFAKTNWKVKPDYVLFAGDASVDPKGYTAQGGEVSNKVPTMLIDTDYLETSSDESLVDFNNDGNGELSFGRLPVRTEAELNAVLNKILGRKGFTADEIRQKGVLFVSDSTADYDFAGASNRLGNLLPSGTNVQSVKRSDGTADQVRGQITNAINGGAVIVNFFGHGTTAGWTSSNILRSQDAAALTNNEAVLMTMFTCLNGNYTELSNESIAEAMFKKAQGGAFAVIASSGMNYADVQEIMNRSLYQLTLSGARIGDAARQSKQSLGNLSHRRTWILFGDPTQKLVR